MEEALIQDKEIRMAASVLRAIDHPLRRKILYLLETKRKLTVTDIYIALRIGQSVCSSHLLILRKARIVNVQRDSKFRYYYIIPGRLEEINLHARELFTKVLK